MACHYAKGSFGHMEESNDYARNHCAEQINGSVLRIQKICMYTKNTDYNYDYNYGGLCASAL